MTRKLHEIGRRALLLALALMTAPLLAQTGTEEEPDPAEFDRPVKLVARLESVNELPMPKPTAIARFRIEGGAYNGALFQLSYEYFPPVRLRNWGLHQGSLGGARQIGGGRIVETPVGQWDGLLRPASSEPAERILLTLIQTDLRRGEDPPRWYFKALESIEPLAPPSSTGVLVGD